jgi:spermidine synthase
MIRIFPFYALSGFISLGYQVAWFRIFTDWFGSTNLTFALVVANFIGGLAVGALLSERITGLAAKYFALHDRLRVYGLIELLVGFFILLTILARFLPADLWGSFPYVLNEGVWVQTAAYRISQVVTAAACVFIPCFFMGATFPLLCAAYSGTAAGERFPAALYAWNTLGACSGVLACQFLLLPWLGHSSMLWLMAGLNVLLGLYFFVTGQEPAVAVRPEAEEVVSDKAVSAQMGESTPINVLVLCAVLSGLLSGALEGDLFKRISFVIAVHPGATMSFISFWAILAIFLASAAVHRWQRLSLVHIRLLFVLAFACFAVSTNFIDSILGAVQVFSSVLSNSAIPDVNNPTVFPRNLTELLVFTGILVFPPYLLVSLMLPYVCIRMQIRKLSLGYVYGLNTAAFCIGLVGFTLIAPGVNIFYSLKLFTALFALVVLSLWLIRSQWVVWQSIGFLVVLVAVAMLTPAAFDAEYFEPDSPPALNPVRAVKSNSANTTFVVGEGESSALYFGRLRMSANNIRARSYMRLMAHFPLLLHPQPQKALLICFGAGNTAAAIATHDGIRQIDVVDLNEKVFATAPEFAGTNSEVYLDPRVRLIHDDGRNFLNLTDQTYDLITSEPPPPLAAGVYRLYSREYYSTALEHLSPNGMMTQWLPLYLMNPEVVEAAISTFQDVFPHAMIFTGFGTDFILVGSRSPIDLSNVEKRFHDSDRVVRDLDSINVESALNLLARIVAGDREMRDRYSIHSMIHDEHNDLEHSFRDRARPAIVGYDPEQVLHYIDSTAPDKATALEPILMHLGRLRYHVRAFPFETLAFVRNPNVALGDVEWVQIGRLYDSLGAAIDANRSAEAIQVLEDLLMVAAEQPEVLLALGDLRIRSGKPAAALSPLREFQKLEPEDSSGHHLIGRALMLTGDSDGAVREFRKAIQLDPNAVKPKVRMAWIYATHPDPDRTRPGEAIRIAETAATLTDHRDSEVLGTLAAAYASAGKFDRAIEISQTAIDQIPANSGDGLADMLRLHQRAYRQGQSLLDQSLN